MHTRFFDTRQPAVAVSRRYSLCKHLNQYDILIRKPNNNNTVLSYLPHNHEKQLLYQVIRSVV